MAIWIESWRLHSRTALHTIRIVGSSMSRIILGIIRITIVVYSLMPWAWGIDLSTLPAWAMPKSPPPHSTTKRTAGQRVRTESWRSRNMSTTTGIPPKEKAESPS